MTLKLEYVVFSNNTNSNPHVTPLNRRESANTDRSGEAERGVLLIPS